MVPLQLSYSECSTFGVNVCLSQLLFLLTDDRLTATLEKDYLDEGRERYDFGGQCEPNIRKVGGGG